MPVTNNPISGSAIVPMVETKDSAISHDNEFESQVTFNSESQSLNGVHGLSNVEMNDPNSIHVTISDPKAPLVILFGPPACGKSWYSQSPGHSLPYFSSNI